MVLCHRRSIDALAVTFMNLHDYLLAQEGHDWPELLAGWGRELPPEFTMWMVNRLGDLIIVPPDGSVAYFDIGLAKLEILAHSKDHFATLIDESDNADRWFAIPLIDRLVAAGMRPGPGQCYGFKIPPILGGTYDDANFEPTDLDLPRFGGRFSVLAF